MYIFYRGQGFDFDLEEKIKDLKLARAKIGDKGYLLAAVVVYLMPELDNVVNAILGRDKRNSKARTVIDRARDRKSFGEVLTSFDSLKKTPGRMITASITVLSAYRKT